MPIKAIVYPLSKKLRLFCLDMDIDGKYKEVYLGLWFWLIVFYRSDVD